MKKFALWGAWLFVTVALGLYFGQKFLAEGDKSTFLVGEATYGHFQIEMACGTCHSSPFGGDDVLQDACIQCHAEELDVAHDSHPKSKFTNPRNADRVEILDARYCITCHTEHQQEQTRAMGVSLPDDYCYQCHQELEKDRPSHKDLAFDGCASAGCHNYHDNRALYEDFLVEHAKDPWLTTPSVESMANTTFTKATDTLIHNEALTVSSSAFQAEIRANADMAHDWQASSHAQAGVDCGGCHTQLNNREWIDKPSVSECASCHKQEAKSFMAGKHGMRLSGKLSATLSPMTSGESHMSFKADTATLAHGCNACHGAHQFDPLKAAVSGCLNCHNDEHSLAFESSPHGQLWQASLTGTPKGPVVTCASCHMPRQEVNIQGQKVFAVQHNQNGNLRPNEKMIRPVCMDCHGLAFAIDALADPALIQNNFNGQPSQHIKSIDWALKRLDEETP